MKKIDFVVAGIVFCMLCCIMSWVMCVDELTRIEMKIDEHLKENSIIWESFIDNQKKNEVKIIEKIYYQNPLEEYTVEQQKLEQTRNESIIKTSTSRKHLTKSLGVFAGPSGKETYYNLNMQYVVSYMRDLGFDADIFPYWVRGDGVKMLGDYVMIAADLNTRPKGTILETSLGMGIVCDTGEFAKENPTQIDIAVNW